MISRPLLVTLFTSVVVLPMATLVFYSAGRLLGAMHDAGGEAVLVRVSQATGVAWVLAIVVLLLGLALDAIDRGPRGDKGSD